MRKLLLFFLTLSTALRAQHQVPDEIQFAGMTLQLTSGARHLIQEDMNAIMKNQKYFAEKVERTNLYFPLIEKIFQEASFPNDFKYLALQESSLLPDAVSSSKAVGYWQFKKETAQEVGLRIDWDIDERMNIISSTQAAVRYLQKNNSFLNNWVYTLLAYNLGRGGVAPHVKDKYKGATSMEIDKSMHWYVIRFLAHKLAYEHLAGKAPHAHLVLQTQNTCQNRTLKEIAQENHVSYEELVQYNKWLHCSKVPDDKVYTVLLPVKAEGSPVLLASMGHNDNSGLRPSSEQTPILSPAKKKNLFDRNSNRPTSGTAQLSGRQVTEINKLRAIKSQPGDSFGSLAESAGISLETFLNRNDIQEGTQPAAGQFYYLEAKRNNALVPFHILQNAESLWEVSQKYGVRMNSIKKKNRMKLTENALPGRVLWLKKKRPRNTPVEYKVLKSVAPEPKQEVVAALPTPETPKKETEKTEKANTRKKISEEPVVSKPAAPKAVVKAVPVYHTLKQGQTLYSVAKQYRTTVDSLMSWNQVDVATLKIGQQILVGKKLNVEEEEEQIIHVVKEGDTIYKIARIYGVSAKEVLLWNNKTEATVKAGEEIVILEP